LSRGRRARHGCDDFPARWRSRAIRLEVATLAAAAALCVTACDKEPSATATPEAAPLATPTPPPAPEPPRAPDILVDASHVAVGNDQVPTGQPGLADRVGVFLHGRPLVEGQSVAVVAMRNAKPSSVAAVATALERERAASAVVKTEARDGTTQKLTLSFAKTLRDCAAVAWIGKDAAIETWPAGGGTPKRIGRGLAGPDITLGTDAMRTLASGCNSSEIVVGSDDGLPWGLVFDLATSVLGAPGARASAAVLVTSAARGRKIVRE
jgi:hypothetical protein